MPLSPEGRRILAEHEKFESQFPSILEPEMTTNEYMSGQTREEAQESSKEYFKGTPFEGHPDIE